jgi:hypothetical protein
VAAERGGEGHRDEGAGDLTDDGGQPPEAAGATGADDGPGANRVAVGCLMAVAGFFSGAMVAVLIARFYSSATHCQYDAELPACNWQSFAGIGGAIGLVTLPVLVLWRLRRRPR